MVPGISGHLISSAYLEQELLPALLNNHGSGTARHETVQPRLARWWRQVSRALGPSSSARAVFDVAAVPLFDILGHGRPVSTPRDETVVGLAFEPAPIAVIAVPWSYGLEHARRHAIRHAMSAGAEWALVTNGRLLQVVDCTRPWARQKLRIDLGQLAADSRGAMLLCALAAAEALTTAGTSASLRSIVAESDRFAARVCRSLGDGVLSVLPELAASLAAGPRRRIDHRLALEQSLTVVYRLLFLLFAEARGLVPVWNEIYRDAYTVDALYRRLSERRDAKGVWPALQAMAHLAHAGCKAGELEVTPFNGRLFSPRYSPLAARRRVPDAVAANVVMALTTAPSSAGRRRIAYHDLGVEQLGAVYERVLEYEPAATGAPVVLQRTSIERKASGSFYTPRSITEFLVRRTLHPLVSGRSSDEILSLRVLDPAMGSGAFLVAVCLYLADRCERARIRDGEWVAAEVTPADRATLRRQVAERCLYGVDLNPMAVQLARLSLWLTTLASNRPLTFLDHHLAVGNSLIGAWLSSLGRPPAPGRSRPPPPLPLFDQQIAGVLAADVLPHRVRLALAPSDSLQDVRAKETLLEQITRPDGSLSNLTKAADVWCGAALSARRGTSPAVVTEAVRSVLSGSVSVSRPIEEWIDATRSLAAIHSAFHWELAFPEVFLNEAGALRADRGFDAVVGNPPWDMLRADNADTVKRGNDRDRTQSLLQFIRTSGAFVAQGEGHSNCYQLFLERVCQLTRPGGRWGLILPSGIATDLGSSRLRRHLFERTSIDSWIGFDNKLAIFPIHRSVRFVLATATNAGSTEALEFRSGLRDPAVLDTWPSEPAAAHAACLRVSQSRIQAWDPEHWTIPELTTPEALAILLTVSSSVPRLGAADGWNARFGRELNASDDRKHFVARARATDDALPIVQGRHLAPFRVSLADATEAIPRDVAARLIDPAHSFERRRIAYRDVASATNKLTLIAALLPRDTISTHTVFCLKTRLDDESQWCLLGLLNTLVANFLVRLHVTTHVTASLMSRLPVPSPPRRSRDFRELAALARTLATIGIDGAPDAYARLNAIAARLYGLSSGQYAHIVESFPLLAAALRQRCVAAYMHHTETRKHGSTE